MIWNVLTCVALLWCALLTAWRFVDGLKDFRALVAAVAELKRRKKPKAASATQPITPFVSSTGSAGADAELALIGMGYSKTAAREAMIRVPAGSREEMLKAALRVVNQ